MELVIELLRNQINKTKNKQSWEKYPEGICGLSGSESFQPRWSLPVEAALWPSVLTQPPVLDVLRVCLPLRPSFLFFSFLPVMLSQCQGQTMALRGSHGLWGDLAAEHGARAPPGEQYSMDHCGTALASLSSPARIFSEQVTLGAKGVSPAPHRLWDE